MKILAILKRKGLRNVVAEVKFERMRKSLDKDIFIDHVEAEHISNDRPNQIFNN